MTLSMKSEVMRLFSILCRSPTIFRYDLDLGRQELSIESELMLEIFLMYFSIIDKLEAFTGLFIVITTSSFVMWMKSAITSDFMFFKYLLILAMCRLAKFMINSVFDFAIGIITCFLDGSLIIMLTLGFFCLLLLFLALINHLSHFIGQQGWEGFFNIQNIINVWRDIGFESLCIWLLDIRKNQSFLGNSFNFLVERW